MKNPNGYGSVVFLGKGRRNPYGVRLTVNWEQSELDKKKPRQKYKYLSYHPNQKEANIALAKYNDNPYDLSRNSLSFEDVYNQWASVHFYPEGKPPKSDSLIAVYRNAFRYCEPVHKEKFVNLKVQHFEDILNAESVPSSMRVKGRTLIGMMYKFAMKHEVVEKNPANLIELRGDETEKRERIPFSDEEIKLIWAKRKDIYCTMIIISFFSGWRPDELCKLEVKNVDNGVITGGLKTEAGKKRKVPIHSAIQGLIDNVIKNRYNLVDNHLFITNSGKVITYAMYYNNFKRIMKELKMNHIPHEARHTFITLAKEAQMDDNVVKQLVGHASSDLTEKVYTHRRLDILKNEIEKIKPMW